MANPFQYKAGFENGAAGLSYIAPGANASNNTSGTFSVQETTVASGNYALQTANGYWGVYNCTYSFNPYVSFSFRCSALPSTTQSIYYADLGQSKGTYPVTIGLTSAGYLVYQHPNGTTLATGSTAITANAWHTIEFLFNSDNQTFSTRIDGTSDLTYTDSAINNHVPSTMYFGQYYTVTSPVTTYYDNIAIGSGNGTWLGSQVILNPTVDGFSGFEQGTTEDFGSLSGTWAVQSSVVRSGNYALSTTNGNMTLAQYGNVRRYFRFGWRTSAIPSARQNIWFATWDNGKSGTGSIELSLNTNAKLGISSSNGATTTSGTTTISPNTWYLVEVMFDAGVFNVRLNTSSEITGTFSYTGNVVRTSSPIFYLGQIYNGTGPATFYYDDYAAGGNTWIGDGSCLLWKPSNTVSATGWTGTPDATNLYNDLSEVPTDRATSYAQTTTSGASLLVGFSPTGLGNVNSVRVDTWVLTAVTGGQDPWTVQAKSGTTSQTATASVTNNSWGRLVLWMPTDPNTGAAWTNSAVQALSAGAQAYTNTNTHRVSSVWMQTDSAPVTVQNVTLSPIRSTHLGSPTVSVQGPPQSVTLQAIRTTTLGSPTVSPSGSASITLQPIRSTRLGTPVFTGYVTLQPIRSTVVGTPAILQGNGCAGCSWSITLAPIRSTVMGRPNVAIGLVTATGCLCSGSYTDPLLACYPLLETGSGVAGEYKDKSLYALNGQGGGGLSPNTPTPDKGLLCLPCQRFSGRQFIELPADKGGCAAPITITLFAKINSFYQTRTLFSRGDSLQLGYTILNQAVANVITTNPDGTRTAYQAQGSQPLAQGQWYHLAVVWTPGVSLAVYADGILQASVPVTQVCLAPISNSFVGQWQGSQRPQADVELVRVYASAKDAGFLTAEANNVCDPGFVLYGAEQPL